ncbi:MAG TPA: heme-binding protein, partial [Pirellulaceae bacterium]|nr:heme-binding protein [Pirellulaceae bacterium]
RGRFHPRDGQLYLCGMFAWAGNATQPGGFYRLRYRHEPVHLPTTLHVSKSGLTLGFTDELTAQEATDAGNYSVRVWGLKRSASYGSAHVNEHPLPVKSAKLSANRRTVSLEIEGLAPTWGLELIYSLKAADGQQVSGKLHSTVHQLGD